MQSTINRLISPQQLVDKCFNRLKQYYSVVVHLWHAATFSFQLIWLIVSRIICYV